MQVTAYALGRTLGEQVVDDGGVRLSVAVDTAVALVQRDDAPGQVVVDHAVAEVVQVNALGSGVAGQEEAYGAVLGAEVLDDALLFHVVEATVEALDGGGLEFEGGGELPFQVGKGGDPFGKDHDAFVLPAAPPVQLVEQLFEGGKLAVGAQVEHGVEEVQALFQVVVLGG